MKKIAIKVYDSHRVLPKNYWNILGSFYSENVWDIPKEEATDKVIDLFLEYEAEYAVKNYELLAFKGKKLVGVMRVLRHPEKREGWYFCDVNVSKTCRREGIATLLYEKAFDIVNLYYATEYVEASVANDNVASILLHKRFGFENTNVKSEYANFLLPENETMFIKKVYIEVPVIDSEGLHYETFSGLHSKLEGTESSIDNK